MTIRSKAQLPLLLTAIPAHRFGQWTLRHPTGLVGCVVSCWVNDFSLGSDYLDPLKTVSGPRVPHRENCWFGLESLALTWLSSEMSQCRVSVRRRGRSFGQTRSDDAARLRPCRADSYRRSSFLVWLPPLWRFRWWGKQEVTSPSAKGPRFV